MERNRNYRDREGGRVIGGLILVGVGATLLLRNMGFYMPYWLFSWPMILILIGIYSGFKHNFKNNAWYILIAIGGFFLVSRYIPTLNLEPYFWPLLIIVVGVIFILRPNRRDFLNFKNGPASEKWKSADTEQVYQPLNSGTVDSNDFLIVKSVFSGVNRTVVSKNFQGGRISNVFGGSEIDLSQAEINGTVMLRFEVVFGGAKIVVPPHWVVRNEIEGIFHAVDDKRRFNPNAAVTDSAKVLLLKGSAVFGGIEIRSY